MIDNEPYTVDLDMIVHHIKRIQAVRKQTSNNEAAFEVVRELPVAVLDKAASEVQWAEGAFLRKATPNDLPLHRATVTAVRKICPGRGIHFLELTPRAIF